MLGTPAPAAPDLDVEPVVVTGLGVVRFSPRRLPPGVALSTSFGFGGHNAALAFRSAELLP